MKVLRYFVALGFALFLFSPRSAQAQDMASACKALKGAALIPKFAAIPGAPTSINSAVLIPAGGDQSIIEKDLPEHCRVEGRIDPTVGFLLRMPTKTWNGKFMMGGCGGGCGEYLTDRIDPALIRGYAVVVTDMGHKGFAFAEDLETQVEFGYRSTHVTVVVAKVITEEFYKQKPKRNYYWGCSTGGGQGIVESQLYPHDFEGIVVGAPALGGNQFDNTWRARFNADENGNKILDASKGPLVHAAVMRACHTGPKDDILQDPLKCKWDPSEIECKAGQDPKTCLTPQEAKVVRLVFDGPKNEKGESTGWGIAVRGSESVWAPEVMPGQVQGIDLLAVKNVPPPSTREPWFRYGRNPDLREFKKAGGKMILFHGLADNQIAATPTIDYYETATKTMGGEAATNEFFRFFLQPAAGHCRYGEGGAEADWITYLENWVEKGEAPDKIIVEHMAHEPYPQLDRPITDVGSAYLLEPRWPLPAGASDRARPVYTYPNTVQWDGHGDPNKPESWVKVPR